MAWCYTLQLFLVTCILMAEKIVVHTQQAKGCPLLTRSYGCQGRIVTGKKSNLGNFNEIGSVIYTWSFHTQYINLRCQEDGDYNDTRSCLTVDQDACYTYYYQSINNLIMKPNQETFLTGRVLNFTCKSGLTLEGPESIYCRSYNNWSDNAIPRCISGCPYPGDLKNGYYLDKTHMPYTSSWKAFTEQITSHCHKTFKLQGSQMIECLSNGNWSDSLPKCVPTLCQPPQVIPQNGRYVFSDGSDSLSKIIQNGDKLFFKCKKGYTSKENEYTTCTEGGKWHHNKSSGCQIVNCKNPGEVENGFYMLGNTYDNQLYTGFNVSYQTTIYVSCLEGFAISENSQLVCNENGSWSGSKPACINITCDIPPEFENGKYHFKSNEILRHGIVGYKEQILVHCNDGYILRTHPQRTCNYSNSWTGETPICEEILCYKPFTESNGTYMDDTGKVLTLNKIKYNKTITFHCLIGYNLTSGTAIRRCHDNGTWSGTKPKCSPITCTKPKETPCGYYSSNITTSKTPVVEFSYNTTLLFVCNNSKYSCLNKAQDIRCSENGVWSDNKHLCGVLKDIKQEQTGKNDTGNTNSDALIGAVCGVVFIIGSGVFVTFIVLKRRNIFRRKKSDDERQSFRSSLTHATDLAIFIDGQETNIVTERTQIGMADTSRNINRVYYNTTVGDSSNQTYYDFRNSESLPKTAIKIDDLQDVVLNGNNGNKIFETQFKALPQGMVENFSEAVKLENKGKNRYTRLYAYDDTRVVLNTEEDSSSDYINACYVHGFNKSRKYIATQGPTKNTVADFWWMVWQEDTSKIVMLTNLIEEGKNKCIKYWPDDMEESFGNLKICLKKVETHSQFDVRTLSVKKGNSAEKMVTQFHFTVWPDKGIPRYASALVHFLKKVNNAPTHGSGPIIVHCSAGVGRTGTYIALDYLTDQGKTLGYVDVAGCVDSLRRQRVSLVQTLDQYIFVHRALVESLMMSSSTVPAQKFQERYCELQQVDPNKNKTRICIDFENLQRVSPPSEDSLYVSAKLVVNRQKNRDPNVLPVEDFMPFLTTDDGRPLYINAVFLSSYNEKNAFIITQSPLKSTREEFWMLAWEQEVHTIVMLNSTDEIENDEKYWPEGKPTVFGNIHVSKVSTDTASDHIVLTLSLKKNDTTRRIKQIQCGGWRKGNVLPDSPDTILSLLETVRAWQQQTGNHKILVHCMNGADRSGLFCVISSVIERMKIEQDVAIASVVEEMRNAREQIIPCLEQYQFCHEVVLNFIQQYDTYSNFRS